MNNADEKSHIQANVEAVLDYLRGEFKGCELTDRSERVFGHLFTVTNLSAYRRYKLKVSVPRLSDSNTTPASIKRQLFLDNVAGRMRDPTNAGELLWGWEEAC